MPDYSRRRCRTCSRASAKARRAGVRCTPALEGSFDPVAWALLLVACDAGFVIRAAAHRGEALLEAGLLEDRLDLLDGLLRRVEVAEAELFADLEQVLHVGGPLLAPGLADGGEHEVRVAAHALVVEGAAPLGEHRDVRAAAAALDLHATDYLVDHGDVTLLDDDTLWYCYYCYTCQSRCPRHNSVAVINQVIRGMQVESGRGRPHVAMFAEWCGAFYAKGMGGDPHLMFPAIGEAWGEKWTTYMEHLLEIREELGLGDLYPPEKVVKEVQTIFEETGFKERLAAVRGGADDEAGVAGDEK